MFDWAQAAEVGMEEHKKLLKTLFDQAKSDFVMAQDGVQANIFDRVLKEMALISEQQSNLSFRCSW